MRTLALLLALVLAPQAALASVAAFPETALRGDREISAIRVSASAKQLADGRQETVCFYDSNASAMTDDPINHRDPTGQNLESDLAACSQIDASTPAGLELLDRCSAAALEANTGLFNKLRNLWREDLAPSPAVQSIVALNASLKETAELEGLAALNVARQTRNPRLEYSRDMEVFQEERAREVGGEVYEAGRDQAAAAAGGVILGKALEAGLAKVAAKRAEKALKPELKYLRGKKHGLDWTEGPSLAKSSGKPQGQWGSESELRWAGEEAATLKPGEGKYFDLPGDSTAVVHRPDGSTVRARRVWIRNNGTGTFHGYPLE